MCGIGAIFAYGADAPPADAAELLKIREHMAARGPDGAGLWRSADGRIALAHRRLAIIDLNPSGAQPMHSADGSLAITFNGEIYNYRALRAELAAKGARFISESDTEVLLQLYAAHGAAMVEKLRGMYAFALWDTRRQGMLLARDPFGIKPLYIADDGATLRVASQVKALLAGGRIDTREDPAGRVGFYLFGYVPEPFTTFRGIRALQAGTTLWIERNGKKEQRRYFDMTAELRAAEGNARPLALRDRNEALRAAASDTVGHHMIADVPVGVFLSSGLDSATVTALAAERAGASLRTVTLAFDEYAGTEKDEAPLAELIAGQFGARHETRRIDSTEFAAVGAALFRAMDQPTIDGTNVYFVSKVTAATGLKVALSGLGGDELFAGYASFREIPLLVRWLGPFGCAPWFGRRFRVVTAPLFRRFTSPKYAGLFEYGASYEGAYLLRRGLFMPWELTEFLDPELVRAGWREIEPMARLSQTIAGLTRPRLRVSALETQWYMMNQLLRDADWAGMAHSLEIRTPLVDIDFFRRVAPLIASADPPGKRDLATTPNLALPDDVLARRKTGFQVPIREWLRRDAPDAPAERGFRGWARLAAERCYTEA